MQDTPVTVAVEEPEVEEPMADEVDLEEVETTEAPEVIQDPIWPREEQKIMDRDRHREEPEMPHTKQE